MLGSALSFTRPALFICYEDFEMKASTAIAKATVLELKQKALLDPVSEKLAAILEDDGVHITYQYGDGMCVAYRAGMDNACISLIGDFDELLKLDKDRLLEELDKEVKNEEHMMSHYALSFMEKEDESHKAAYSRCKVKVETMKRAIDIAQRISRDFKFEDENSSA